MTLNGPTKYRMLIFDIKLGKDGIRGWDVARRARVIYITGANADEWAIQGLPKSIVRASPACRSRCPTTELVCPLKVVLPEVWL